MDAKGRHRKQKAKMLHKLHRKGMNIYPKDIYPKFKPKTTMRNLKVVVLRDIRNPPSGTIARKGEIMNMVIEKVNTPIGIDVYYKLTKGCKTIKTLDASAFVVVGVE